MDPGMIFVIVLVVLVMSFRAFRPIAHALADVLRSRLDSGPAPNRSDEQLEALRETVEALSNEVVRLTERVDFTERLLEKPREEVGEVKGAP
jgi:peptidoglycan hydrolase CwlO-like protein